ncbi:endonuclease/exonuclease/phosphatase family protein [Siphonobacter sp. SORGH_AS_1065]|uniref:endonuclease/exonuclease/phosphatase family protein n=1 Tax=Siphonobacter sp. SORGH_AS_1065 TaxID=3041795 RepID=UPI002780AAB2|nr:endonuclease/exonuclease/phosphatase family protein [Siphonobacter sp. SORGH_AS_1065]MDQ1085904.1 endonuclease/exonuclease/phosphatase family metal-dependent hydrolase [Siphonobacter sp. SORGH_AS_1065]
MKKSSMTSRNHTGGFFTSLFSLITYALCLYLIIGYTLGYTLWWTHWITGFLLLFLPWVMMLLALLTVFWFFRNVRKAWIPLIFLLAGWPFWLRTIGFHASHQPGDLSHSLRVSTFNTTAFGVSEYMENKDIRPLHSMLNWLKSSNADILCLQEYYSWDYSYLPDEFKLNDQLRTRGYRYKVIFKELNWYSGDLRKSDQGFLGPVLFSKYPIVNQSYHVFENAGGHNGFVMADIKKDSDTIRVISIHLYSMGVRVGNVARAKNSKVAKAETRSILHKLKEGFIAHNSEIEEVLKIVKNSPYPVILCGDYNEVPTGIAYGKTRRYLKNSFEEAGRGFGFTLNRSPWFIRIDNQFHSNHFKVLSHKVRRDIKGSDHFPVEVEYAY